VCSTVRPVVPTTLITVGFQLATSVIGVVKSQLTRRHGVEVGNRVRLLGTVRVNNQGTMKLADRVLIDGRHIPIIISTFGSGTLEIGEGVFMNYGSDIACAGHIAIGAYTRIGPRVTIGDHNGHPIDDATPDTPQPVAIGDDVWLGRNTIVLPGVTIGRGTLVAAGSVVTKSLPECVIAAGVPARVIRDISMPPGFHR
jgi:acetyltransferase-like isoleucine patch superfamily enzyme